MDQQRLGIKRFGNVLECTPLHRFDCAVDVRGSRQDDHGNGWMVFVQIVQAVQAAESRHTQVDQGDRRVG